MYTTEARLQQIYNNMSLSKPLMQGEGRMLLRQEKDLGERFYGIALPSDLYERKGMNGGINRVTREKRAASAMTAPAMAPVRGNGLLQTTGGKAHKEAGDQVRVDFFNHRELVTSAEHALKPVLFEGRGSDATRADDDNLLKIRAPSIWGIRIPGARERHGRRSSTRKAKRALDI